MKFLQLKKHVPRLKFCILFYRIYRNYNYLYRKAGFTCMSVCISKLCQSRKIYVYIYIGYAI